MIANPYEVLGISPGASDDEIKKAYREQSRKYHPDSYADNPLAGLAEEKFKEVQEAYDQIMKDRTGGAGSQAAGGYGRTAGGGYRASSSAGDSPQLQSVATYINSRRFQDALATLSGISEKTARWYYYSAIANVGAGNNYEGLEHARQAVNMEPNNPEYSALLNQLQWGGRRYQSTGQDYGRGSFGTGNLCCDLWCADSLCECMGGDLCSCM